MVFGKKLRGIFWGIIFLPDDIRDKCIFAEYFIDNATSAMNLVVIERHPKADVLRKQFAKQHKTRPHHAQPLIVPQHVLGIHWIRAQPLAHDRRVDVIVVTPVLVACVVGRVDENQIHFTGVARQQALERVKVVTVNDQVAVEVRRSDGLVGVCDQRPVGTVR